MFPIPNTIYSAMWCAEFFSDLGQSPANSSIEVPPTSCSISPRESEKKLEGTKVKDANLVDLNLSNPSYTEENYFFELEIKRALRIYQDLDEGLREKYFENFYPCLNFFEKISQLKEELLRFGSEELRDLYSQELNDVIEALSFYIGVKPIKEPLLLLEESMLINALFERVLLNSNNREFVEKNVEKICIHFSGLLDAFKEKNYKKDYPKQIQELEGLAKKIDRWIGINQALCLFKPDKATDLIRENALLAKKIYKENVAFFRKEEFISAIENFKSVKEVYEESKQLNKSQAEWKKFQSTLIQLKKFFLYEQELFEFRIFELEVMIKEIERIYLR